MAKLEHLEIVAFKEASHSGSGDASFKFMVNPENLSRRHENRFSKIRGINTSGRSARYAYSLSDEMTISLFLDTTLSFEHMPGNLPSAKKPVKETVDRFLKLCFYMDGNTHEPHFLKLVWGDFNFKCRLKSVEVKYAVFDHTGTPRRANLNCVFVADMAAEDRLRLENKKSPDITHHKVVRAGDTLPALTKAVYGDSKHYLLVAEANELDHFRALEPGRKLYFPPLEK